MATREQVNLDSPQSMANKTLSAPVIVGGTIGSAALTGCTADTPTVPTSVATKQYVDSIPSSFTALATQCYLQISAGTMQLIRRDGTRLWINGGNEVIPFAGIVADPTGLPGDTTFFIYAFMSTPTVMALEASTTGYVIGTDGMPVKSGDVTRTLVGMGRSTSAGGAWISGDATRNGVLSYFNRRLKTVRREAPSVLTVPLVEGELNGSFRVYSLVWGDEYFFMGVLGGVQSLAGGDCTLELRLSGAPLSPTRAYMLHSATAWSAIGLSAQAIAPDGFTFSTLYGLVSSGTANVWAPSSMWLTVNG